MALCVEACLLSGHIVKLNMNLCTGRNVLICLDEELGIPVCRRCVRSVNHDTARAVLTSTSSNHGRNRIAAVLLGKEVHNFITCKVTVGNHAHPAISNCWLGIIGNDLRSSLANLGVDEVDVATVGVLHNNVNNTLTSGNSPSLLNVGSRNCNCVTLRVGQLSLANQQFHTTSLRNIVRLNTDRNQRTCLHVLDSQDFLVLTTEPQISRTIISAK